MSQRLGQVVDEYSRPVQGARIYVYNSDGTDAAVTSDGTASIDQPITTDQFGTYSYYAPDNIYREDTVYGGKLRYREVVGIGTISTGAGWIGTDARGDASATLNLTSSKMLQYLDVPLTAARTMTLPAPGNAGRRFRFARSANATGAFNWNINTSAAVLLKALTAASTWADVEDDGTEYRLVASGTLTEVVMATLGQFDFSKAANSGLLILLEDI